LVEVDDDFARDRRPLLQLSVVRFSWKRIRFSISQYFSVSVKIAIFMRVTYSCCACCAFTSNITSLQRWWDAADTIRKRQCQQHSLCRAGPCAGCVDSAARRGEARRHQ